MSERRQSTRQKSLLRGCIYFNNRRSAFNCLIRDISATGARLILSETISVPDVIDLYVSQKEETLRARVQCAAAANGGRVRSAAHAPRKPADDLAERVEKLEAEVAALKKLLKRLKSDVAGDAEDAA